MRTGAIVCQDCGASASNTRAWNTRADLSPTWRSIDSAPKDGTEILVWDTERTIARWIDGEWMPCLPDQQPTLWQHLPQPPEDTK